MALKFTEEEKVALFTMLNKERERLANWVMKSSRNRVAEGANNRVLQIDTIIKKIRESESE